MQPCTCKEKGSGLDVTCENVDSSQLEKVTKNMYAYDREKKYQVGSMDKSIFGLDLVSTLYIVITLISSTNTAPNPACYRVTVLLSKVVKIQPC